MGYRDIAIEAINVAEAFSDCMAILISGQRLPEKDAAKMVATMMSAPRRLRRMIEVEDKVARFVREVDSEDNQ